VEFFTGRARGSLAAVSDAAETGVLRERSAVTKST
jgi:hypothetical protein